MERVERQAIGMRSLKHPPGVHLHVEHEQPNFHTLWMGSLCMDPRRYISGIPLSETSLFTMVDLCSMATISLR